MSCETWGAFVLAAVIILVIPGPTIISVVSHAVVHGRRAVAPLVLGVTLGDFTAMTLSLLGLGAVMAASAQLFAALKWVGALYLVYLGIKLWRSSPAAAETGSMAVGASGGSLFSRTYVVTTLNPKSIAFFVAFLPQFVDHRYAAGPQFVVLGVTFLVLATLNAALYGMFAGRCSAWMQRSSARRWLNRCGGSALIGAGLFTAAMRRTA